jgi:D-glycero-alpha-D-manno-heptose-7-phosphate kinase
VICFNIGAIGFRITLRLPDAENMSLHEDDSVDLAHKNFISISKTPFRISLFGGGSDYPEHASRYGGIVLAGAINKYCYITYRHLPQDFGARYRIRYTITENQSLVSNIEHPAVREIFNYYKIDQPTEMNHSSDLPSKSGMGSSSSFIVGLISSIEASRGKNLEKYELARLAIELEQTWIKENVGYQDAVTTAFGGVNMVKFSPINAEFEVHSLAENKAFLSYIAKNLLLVRIPIERIASDIAKAQIEHIEKHADDLTELGQMAEAMYRLIEKESLSIQQLGQALDDSWQIKKRQSNLISNQVIDDFYSEAKVNGALGGKLCGAGGGGFMLLVVPESLQNEFRRFFSKMSIVSFDWDFGGNQNVQVF